MEFTVADLALATNKSESYIRRRISQSDLVARREGRRLYVAQDEAARWARENSLTFVPTIPNSAQTEDVRDRAARVTVLVWQGEPETPRVLLTHLMRLRRKLGEDGDNPRYISLSRAWAISWNGPMPGHRTRGDGLWPG